MLKWAATKARMHFPATGNFSAAAETSWHLFPQLWSHVEGWYMYVHMQNLVVVFNCTLCSHTFHNAVSSWLITWLLVLAWLTVMLSHPFWAKSTPFWSFTANVNLLTISPVLMLHAILDFQGIYSLCCSRYHSTGWGVCFPTVFSARLRADQRFQVPLGSLLSNILLLAVTITACVSISRCNAHMFSAVSGKIGFHFQQKTMEYLFWLPQETQSNLKDNVFNSCSLQIITLL